MNTQERMQAEAKTRSDAIRAKIKARTENERAAEKLVISRSGISEADILKAFHVLTAIAEVDLDDLLVPPGFNLLPNGEVGSANDQTPEWQHWQTATTLCDDALHLAKVLTRYV